MKKALMFIIVLIVLAVGVFVITTRKTAQEEIPQQEETQQELSHEERKIQEEDETTQVEVAYPVISGIQSSEKINTEIGSFINETIKDFENRNKGNELLADNKHTLGVEYSWRKPQHNVLSIPFIVFEYSSGAAHPNSFHTTLNFNLTSGNQITLKDLFPNNQDYLQEVSTLSRRHIEEFEQTLEAPLEDTWVQTGTDPKEENFKNFIVERDNLKIIFNPYQIAPYALGAVEIEIPISSFESITFPN